MAMEVLLPRQGNTVESCIILEWKKGVGDTVTDGEPIAEVETDKATFPVESPVSGTLLKQLVSEGDDVPVLSPIAIVGAAGESVATASQNDQPDPVTAAVTAEPGEVKSSVAAGTTAATGRQASHEREPRDRIRISPRARRLASEHHVALDSVAGTGPGGRIMVRDVEKAAATGATAKLRHAARAETSGSQRIELRGIRKVIAERMRASLSTTAQLTMNRSADASALLSYRERLKASGDAGLAEISVTDLCLFALSRALRDCPELNATFRDGMIERHNPVHLGFAVDTPRGLMVPVIQNAERRTLADLAIEAHRLAAACQDGSVTPDELSNGTFTMTNLGAYGIESFTPVLNAPQVAILGVCSIEPKPVLDGETTRFVPSLGLCLTIDHQVVDGAPAARFLQSLSARIAAFELALAD